MRAYLIITAVVTHAAVQGSTLQAQQAPKVAARVALGVAYGGGSFGDDDPRQHEEIGINIGGQLRKPLAGSKALVLEGTFQPNALENWSCPGFEDTRPQGGVRRCHDATYTPTVCS